MSGRFHERVALVTGSTQGLGRALLLRMAGEGLAGAVVTGRNAERGADVCAELGELGCEAVFVAAELDSADDIDALIAAADDRFGHIDHLANCAAVTDRGDVWTTTPDFWDWMMAVNVRAPFLLTQGVARIARREGRPASVVNIGSVAGYGGPDFITAYSVSKGALLTLTKSLAFQLMRHHIRVVQVNPGWMDTPGEDLIQRKYHGGGDDWLERAEAERPFGRLIKTDELARTLAFVLSDDAGMMTGSIIDYDQTVLGAGAGELPPLLEPDGDR
ncbi:MAG: SDR family oxidoreductase [Ilumatobacteraceae bacterium]|nr:SDR family oxidoreductase [Ilumatobacteraceae bacterium]